MDKNSQQFNERALLARDKVAQPVSKQQLEVLRKQLASPKLTLELTPFGSTANGDLRKNKEIADRMAEIRQRLNARKSLAKQAFRRAGRKH